MPTISFLTTPIMLAHIRHHAFTSTVMSETMELDRAQRFDPFGILPNIKMNLR